MGLLAQQVQQSDRRSVETLVEHVESEQRNRELLVCLLLKRGCHAVMRGVDVLSAPNSPPMHYAQVHLHMKCLTPLPPLLLLWISLGGGETGSLGAQNGS